MMFWVVLFTWVGGCISTPRIRCRSADVGWGGGDFCSYHDQTAALACGSHHSGGTHQISLFKKTRRGRRMPMEMCSLRVHSLRFVATSVSEWRLGILQPR